MLGESCMTGSDTEEGLDSLKMFRCDPERVSDGITTNFAENDKNNMLYVLIWMAST
jgi:hypothetical protein